MVLQSSTPQAMSFDQTQYQEKARKLITLVNQLRDAGAQFSLDLPCMVVCGNQSAGKSSLLERLCGVKLPRAAGTCTKCPTEVRLSTSPPGGSSGVTWCCQIKLRREYGKDNKQVDPRPKEEAFKSLTQDDEDELHYYISAAQRALLNPDTPSDIFVAEADRSAALARTNNGSNGSFEDLNAATSSGANPPSKTQDVLKFTRNVIVLEITGADVDLALIDLPGIIQSEQGDDGSNVQLVKQLVEQYISSPSAIIVATISCKDDIDNQAIVQMARDADKEGHRTIGVLTKADTIEPGTHHTWLPILQGENYKLLLGYYVVVNPSQADIDNSMTQQQAAVKEQVFFQTDLFFSSGPVGDMRNRFGVDALRLQLSKQLVALTQRELPKMKHALEKALNETQRLLAGLPPPPSSDPAFELHSRLHKLAVTAQDAVKGDDNTEFYRAVDVCYCQFKQAVLAARPTVRLDNSSSSSAAPTTTQTTTGEEDPDFWLQGPAAGSAGSDHTWSLFDDERHSDSELVITLESAHELARKYRVRELSTFSPYRVLEELVQGLKGRWDDAALKCLHDVGEELQRLSDSLVDQHFGQFAVAHQQIRALLFEMHSRLLVKTSRRVREFMAMEGEQVWTQNNHYLSDSQTRFEERLVQQLHPFGKATNPDRNTKLSNGFTAKASVDSALSYLAAAGITLTAQDLDLALARKQVKTAGEEEGLLELVAGSLAYFKVSSKRMIDGVPMHVRHHLLSRFYKQLSDLPAQLAAGTPGPETSAATAADVSISTTGFEADADSSDDEDDVVGDSASRFAAAAAAVGAPGSSGGEPGLVVWDAARLMAEDESTAERRAHLRRQLQQLQQVAKILTVF